MPQVPQPRPGVELRVRQRPLTFSYWPMRRTTRRFGVSAKVFVTNPWTLIKGAIQSRCPAAAKPAALAFFEQAEDFFRAASPGVSATKPLLLYYAFLNLAKAYVLTVGQHADLSQLQHGLSEQLRPRGRELLDAYLDAYVSPARDGKLNMFDEFLRALSGTGLGAPLVLSLPVVLPQVVAGHRLWSAAAGEDERFVSIERIVFAQDVAAKAIWLRFYLFADDVVRLGLGHQELLDRCRLNGVMHEVDCNEIIDGRRLLLFEQIAVTNYAHRPSDVIQVATQSIRSKLWAIVTSTPPYRKYYLYPAPAAEHGQILPQLLSVYAIMYYLGSITRYRPHHFDSIDSGNFGPMIEAFLNDQPNQFLFLLASEFAKQEVAKAAIV